MFLEEQYQQYLYPEESLELRNNSSTSPNLQQPIQHKAIANSTQMQMYGRNSDRGPQEYDPGYNYKNTKPRDAIQIILTNKPSQINKKLLKFLNNNLEALNTNNLIFEWIIVYPEEMKQYKEQNITKFPVLIPVGGMDNPDSYQEGLNSIFDFIKSQLISQNERNIKKMGKNENGEYDINNYLLEQMKEEDDDDIDEEKEFASTIQQKCAELYKARDPAGQHTKSMSNPEISEKIAKAASKQNGFGFSNQNIAKPIQKRKTKGSRKDNIKTTEHGETNGGGLSPQEILRKSKRGPADMDDDLMDNFWENQTTSDDL